MPENDILTGAALHSHHDLGLVLLSIAVAIMASFVALDLAGRIRETRGGSQVGWWLAGAVAMGGGIWSMHFIAMLAFQLGTNVTYDVATTVLSLVIAIVVSGLGLFVVYRQRGSWPAILGGGVLAGAGIAAMHYTGMAAMRMASRLSYDPVLFGLSVVIAIAAATAALWLTLRPQRLWQQLGSAIVMGAAISGMHFTGMAAARFEAVAPVGPATANGLSNDYLAVAIGVTTALLLAARPDRNLHGPAVRPGATRGPDRRGERGALSPHLRYRRRLHLGRGLLAGRRRPRRSAGARRARFRALLRRASGVCRRSRRAGAGPRRQSRDARAVRGAGQGGAARLAGPRFPAGDPGGIPRRIARPGRGRGVVQGNGAGADARRPAHRYPSQHGVSTGRPAPQQRPGDHAGHDRAQARRRRAPGEPGAEERGHRAGARRSHRHRRARLHPRVQPRGRADLRHQAGGCSWPGDGRADHAGALSRSAPQRDEALSCVGPARDPGATPGDDRAQGRWVGVPGRAGDQCHRREWTADLHRVPARCQRRARGRSAAAPGAEDGLGRSADGRRRPRLQQPADRHHRGRSIWRWGGCRATCSRRSNRRCGRPSAALRWSSGCLPSRAVKRWFRRRWISTALRPRWRTCSGARWARTSRSRPSSARSFGARLPTRGRWRTRC